jgi:hypothetical protein
MEELIAVLQDRYEYRDGGLWVRKQFNSQSKIGQRAGSSLRDGYRQVRVNGKKHREHHLVWLLHTGALPVGELDHINCIRDDNRIENLRECTRSQNMQNRRFAMANNQIGLIGVVRHYKKFRAAITQDGRKKHLGLFDTAQAAHEAYMAAQRAHRIGGEHETP